MENPFAGRLPTEPDVNKLLDVFRPAYGAEVPYTAIQEVIEEEAGSPRFQSVVANWRRRLFREYNIQTKALGGVVYLLNADQSQEEGRKRFGRMKRASQRQLTRLESIRVENLSTEEKRVENAIMKRYAHELHAEMTKVVRSISPPRKVGTDGLRLARGE